MQETGYDVNQSFRVNEPVQPPPPLPSSGRVPFPHPQPHEPRRQQRPVRHFIDENGNLMAEIHCERSSDGQLIHRPLPLASNGISLPRASRIPRLAAQGTARQRGLVPNVLARGRNTPRPTSLPATLPTSLPAILPPSPLPASPLPILPASPLLDTSFPATPVLSTSLPTDPSPWSVPFVPEPLPVLAPEPGPVVGMDLFAPPPPRPRRQRRQKPRRGQLPTPDPTPPPDTAAPLSTFAGSDDTDDDYMFLGGFDLSRDVTDDDIAAALDAYTGEDEEEMAPMEPETGVDRWKDDAVWFMGYA